jgi:hypothetical protein
VSYWSDVVTIHLTLPRLVETAKGYPGINRFGLLGPG